MSQISHKTVRPFYEFYLVEMMDCLFLTEAAKDGGRMLRYSRNIYLQIISL